jgi:hypothetical protein
MEPANESASTLQDEPKPVVIKREQEKDLVVWSAPSRPFKRRDRQFYVTIFSIAGILGLILFLAEGIMPVLLIVSLVFLGYVLSTVEPDNIEYKVTNKGVRVAEKITFWPDIVRFWFSNRLDSELLVLETLGLPGRMELVIKPEIKDSLKREIEDYVPFEEIPSSGFDRLTNWFSAKLPGNR